MDYYTQIKEQLINDEIYSSVKDYSKEKHKILTYYNVGRLLYEAGKHYGKGIINNYSEKLINEVGKKYNKRTLYRMRKLYIVFSNEKVTTMLTQLTWSHYLLLLSMKDYNEIIYYINICKSQNLDVRSLQKRINNHEYERLSIEAKNKLTNKEELLISDMVKNPIVINNKFNTDKISEKMLQKLIIEDLPSFMKELGSGFSFIENEYKIKIGSSYNYIDLLLYNYIYKSFVVIELKVTEFKKEYIGQIEVYMNYIDSNIKDITDNDTIGIIICKKENKFIIEYASDTRILQREYILN